MSPYRRGPLLVGDGDMNGFGCRFSVAEPLHDSAESKEAQKEAKRARRESRRGL
ncbi:hypothetical protein [Streptomyces sp. NPDC088350]|uniref:hypothetical protein n=1 Tax=Streptomyces sp. NPDC088350 TaxID=3365854 RepID=UPI00381A72D6